MPLDPSRSTPHGFWRYAAEYFHAAEAVRKTPGKELLTPALQLYGQSIELALKAFLLKRGASLSEVKNISHSLSKALREARRRKLGTEVKLSQSEIKLIYLLDSNYSNHRFRYIVTGPNRVPQLSSISKVCNHLVAELERYCTGMTWGLYRGR